MGVDIFRELHYNTLVHEKGQILLYRRTARMHNILPVMCKNGNGMAECYMDHSFYFLAVLLNEDIICRAEGRSAGESFL